MCQWICLDSDDSYRWVLRRAAIVGKVCRRVAGWGVNSPKIHNYQQRDVADVVFWPIGRCSIYRRHPMSEGLKFQPQRRLKLKAFVPWIFTEDIITLLCLHFKGYSHHIYQQSRMPGKLNGDMQSVCYLPTNDPSFSPTDRYYVDTTGPLSWTVVACNLLASFYDPSFVYTTQPT